MRLAQKVYNMSCNWSGFGQIESELRKRRADSLDSIDLIGEARE